MTKPRMFSEADLTKALSDTGKRVSRKLAVYLIGGCAMTFMGRKVSTKDIDVVLGSSRDAKEFRRALKLVGFASVRRVTGPYAMMGTFDIMENNQRMRFDIFDRRVCSKLKLSEGMKSRAHLYRSFDRLTVFLMAPEDIFLFKGITERGADLEDMRILAEAGLEWKTVEHECLSQPRSEVWASMLGSKLMELRKNFDIRSPIIKTLLDHGDISLLLYAFGSVIGKRQMEFKEVARGIDDKFGYKTSWTRKYLTLLIVKNFIRKNQRNGTYFYSMRN